MRRKVKNPRFLTAALVVLAALCSASSLAAQCGVYFKSNYSAINKLEGGFYNPDRFDDWNGDGRPDIWSFRRNPSTSLLDVIIYPTKPSGYWDWDNPIIYATTFVNGGGNYRIVDTDSDGRKDLVDGGQIHRNTGNGSLTPTPGMTTDDGIVQIIGLANINGDNLLDVVYNSLRLLQGPGAPEYESRIRYQTQNPDGSFSNTTTVLVETPQNGLDGASITVGDFNGDGKTDIVYGSLGAGSIWRDVVLKNVGGGNFEAQPRIENGFPPSSTGVIDFNRDGRDDVLGWGKLFYGRADSTFDVVTIPGAVNSLFPAEINGDNNLDIIEVGTGFYATLVNDGANGFTRTVYNRDLGTAYTLNFADYSGDGKADIFQYDPYGSQFGNTNIFNERLISIKESVCNPAGETKMANLDGNANADIVMWNPNSGNWSAKDALWGSGTSTSARNFQWGSGALGDVPAPGDYDGDGKTDTAVYRNSTGTWYIFRSSDSSWYVLPFGLTDDIAVPNDYDGGGKTDIAVFRPSDGNWYIWFTETQSFGALHFGATGDKPVPADYDGDRKTDLAVYRPSTGNWYYLKSSDLNYVVFHWGNATDIPVPADYDGDGKADITIYRDGFWWIWRSSTNAYTVAQWGQAGDIPMPVYRNSVSADLILYRPSHNLWYSFNYRGSQGIQHGLNGDAPVYFGLPNN